MLKSRIKNRPVNAKLDDQDETYFAFISQLDDLYDTPKDLIFNYPAYVGAPNLARTLGFYEIYKQVHDVAGHIADIGSSKGRTLLLFAKLVQLFESNNYTEVHGFDWFKGMHREEYESSKGEPMYVGNYERLKKLIEVQGLDGFTAINKLDLTKDLPGFFEQNPHCRYKLIYLDCGINHVMETCLEHFWPRLVTGGILVMDHYNHQVSPNESDIVDKYVGNRPIKQIPTVRLPTAYIVK
tara:strand:- start:164 stop:880 length:717 start_codon:yes stop_codon:yes gene_type:complete